MWSREICGQSEGSLSKEGDDGSCRILIQERAIMRERREARRCSRNGEQRAAEGQCPLLSDCGGWSWIEGTIW